MSLAEPHHSKTHVTDFPAAGEGVVVGFVDVILVVEQVVDRRRLGCDRFDVAFVRRRDRPAKPCPSPRQPQPRKAPSGRIPLGWCALVLSQPPPTCAGLSRLQHQCFACETGSRNFSKRSEPPRLCGQPSHPAKSEQSARMISGMVIDLGDSWMWCSTSWLMRGLP